MFGSSTPWKYWCIHCFLPGYGTLALSGVLADAVVAPRWEPQFSSNEQSLSIFFRKDTREDLLDQVPWAVSWCGPTNYCAGTAVGAVGAGIRGSSTCGTSSVAEVSFFWYFSVKMAWSGQNTILCTISKILLLFSHSRLPALLLAVFWHKVWSQEQAEIYRDKN